MRDGSPGGTCYGYRLERRSDGSGRKFTVAIINEEQAIVVRRIYDEFLMDRGFKQIAHRLNSENVPAPSAGRRGSGSWVSAAVRTILLNPRYRGLYMHGRTKKVRNGGGVAYVKADPKDVITTEVPEWRIVDDATWLAAQERFTKRGGTGPRRKQAAKYALTGLGHCKGCGGAIVSHRVRTFGGGEDRMMAYGCSRHRDRGSAVCPVTVYQDLHEVEDAIVAQLQQHVLSDKMLRTVLGEIGDEIKNQIPQRNADVDNLEAELAAVRTEQKRLAKAVARSDAIPELISELQQRSARIINLEAQLAAAKRTPSELLSLMKKVEGTVRDNVRALREALADHADLREVFEVLFPNGLTFAPTRTPDGKRQIWEIEGDARFDRLDQARFRLSNDPVDGGNEAPPKSSSRKHAKSDDLSSDDSERALRFRKSGDPNG